MSTITIKTNGPQNTQFVPSANQNGEHGAYVPTYLQNQIKKPELNVNTQNNPKIYQTSITPPKPVSFYEKNFIYANKNCAPKNTTQCDDSYCVNQNKNSGAYVPSILRNQVNQYNSNTCQIQNVDIKKEIYKNTTITFTTTLAPKAESFIYSVQQNGCFSSNQTQCDETLSKKTCCSPPNKSTGAYVPDYLKEQAIQANNIIQNNITLYQTPITPPKPVSFYESNFIFGNNNCNNETAAQCDDEYCVNQNKNSGAYIPSLLKDQADKYNSKPCEIQNVDPNREIYKLESFLFTTTLPPVCKNIQTEPFIYAVQQSGCFLPVGTQCDNTLSRKSCCIPSNKANGAYIPVYLQNELINAGILPSLLTTTCPPPNPPIPPVDMSKYIIWDVDSILIWSHGSETDGIIWGR
jgi:phage FluMu gp28-like protein